MRTPVLIGAITAVAVGAAAPVFSMYANDIGAARARIATGSNVVQTRSGPIEYAQLLPASLRERLNAMSPINYLPNIRAPLIVLLHDRDDPVIPASESRTLRDALACRNGIHYTEFTVFKHLDPTKGHPKPVALARELVRFARAIYPLFEQAAA